MKKKKQPNAQGPDVQETNVNAEAKKSAEMNAEAAAEAGAEKAEASAQKAEAGADKASKAEAPAAPEKTEAQLLQEKLDAANDKYLRLQAEFDNYRKRTAKERMELILTAGEDIIKGLLPVLDDVQRAIQTLEQLENKDENALEGIRLINKKLYSYLESKGLKPIEAKGLDLDTDKHAAVAKIPAPEKKLKGKIVDVIQEGYTLNGKVIRFSNVVMGE